MYVDEYGLITKSYIESYVNIVKILQTAIFLLYPQNAQLLKFEDMSPSKKKVSNHVTMSKKNDALYFSIDSSFWFVLIETSDKCLFKYNIRV